MFKTILVPATGTLADDPVFATAALAAGQGGHVEFLHVRVDFGDMLSAIAAGGVVLAGAGTAQEDVDRMDRDETALAEKARAAVAAFCARSGWALDGVPAPGAGSAAFVLESGNPPVWMADHGRFADLIVLGRGSGPFVGVEEEALETTLLDTGRPLLIAPHVPPVSLTDTVVIGWTDRPQTLRAISAAMPFIDAAKDVVILSVQAEGARDETAERLLRALRWHNSAVRTEHVVQDGREPAALLLAEAARVGASLLIMGGYSHSPLRELLFGGATRTVMAGAELPVLMAH